MSEILRKLLYKAGLQLAVGELNANIFNAVLLAINKGIAFCLCPMCLAMIFFDMRKLPGG